MISILLFICALSLAVACFAASPSGPSRFQVSTPKRFAVASGMLGDVITAAPSFALRLGSGAFVTDYGIELENVSAERKDGKWLCIYRFV